MENQVEKIFNKRFFIKKSKEAGVMKLDNEIFNLINKIHGKTKAEIIGLIGVEKFDESISSCMVKPKEGHVEPVREPKKKVVRKPRPKRENNMVQAAKGHNSNVPANTPLMDNKKLLELKKSMSKKK